MKLFLLLVVLGCGVANASLRSEVDQLLAFYPMEKVREIYDHWIVTSAQVGEIYSFLGSDESAEVYKILVGQPELQGVGAWTEARDVNLRDYLDTIALMFGWPMLPRHVRSTRAAGSDWDDMMAEIRAVTNTAAAVELANSFIATPGSEFAELFRMTKDARVAFTRTMEHATVEHWGRQMRAFGVNIDETIARIRGFFQWS